MPPHFLTHLYCAIGKRCNEHNLNISTTSSHSSSWTSHLNPIYAFWLIWEQLKDKIKKEEVRSEKYYNSLLICICRLLYQVCTKTGLLTFSHRNKINYVGFKNHANCLLLRQDNYWSLSNNIYQMQHIPVKIKCSWIAEIPATKVSKKLLASLLS